VFDMGVTPERVGSLRVDDIAQPVSLRSSTSVALCERQLASEGACRLDLYAARSQFLACDGTQIWFIGRH